MNNKFKGLYDTEGTSFISDKVEPINYYEPTIKTAKIQNHTYSIKTAKIQNHTYSINFDKTELYKEIERLKQELQRKDNIIKELKKHIGEEWYCYDNESIEFKVAKDILSKIEELEKM